MGCSVIELGVYRVRIYDTFGCNLEYVSVCMYTYSHVAQSIEVKLDAGMEVIESLHLLL